MMPLGMFGRGMVRTVNVLSTCVTGSQQIVLIEEIENGIHYRAMSDLLAVLLDVSRRRGVQFFVTSHSTDMLKGLIDVLGPR